MRLLKNLNWLLICLAIVLVSQTSLASDTTGYYFKGEIGYGFPNDPDTTSGAGVASTNESNDDIMKFGIGLGYNSEGPLRTELTFSYTPDMDNTANSNNATTVKASGDNYLFLINAYYDFDEVDQGFVPYIGGGIGLSRIVSDEASITNSAGTINITEGGAGKNNLGWALGFGTALLGKKATMLCTASVEEVIEEHYQNQLKKLGNDEMDLKSKIEKFKSEEVIHKNIAYESGATNKGLYSIMDKVIRTGSRIAITISEKI